DPGGQGSRQQAHLDFLAALIVTASALPSLTVTVMAAPLVTSCTVAALLCWAFFLPVILAYFVSVVSLMVWSSAGAPFLPAALMVSWSPLTSTTVPLTGLAFLAALGAFFFAAARVTASALPSLTVTVTAAPLVTSSSLAAFGWPFLPPALVNFVSA